MPDRLLTRNLMQRAAVPDGVRAAMLLSPGHEEFFSYYYFAYASALGRWQAPGRFGEESGE
ncbi:MAG: hypothetical protein M8467_06660 [Anaerolineae bacterium]|nr:hypothetical protein [Anaerolineae bacterium]